jgi:3-oxoadipate enol-lactonase
MEAKIGDIILDYELVGPSDAPVIACSHCLAGSSGIWDAQVIALRENYRVLTYDTRGHGDSSAPDGPYSMEMLADDAAALFSAIGIARVHFMGISMGGMIAQVLALTHPEYVSSLILCDTTCGIPKEAGALWDERIQTARDRGMEALVEGTLERWLSPDFRANSPATTERIREIVVNTPPSGFTGCCQAIKEFDYTDRIPDIKAPTLILVGENDPGTPVEKSREIHEKISGSEFYVLPQAYHLSNIEAADTFNKQVLKFLARH